jgi:hypothetical protein
MKSHFLSLLRNSMISYNTTSFNNMCKDLDKKHKIIHRSKKPSCKMITKTNNKNKQIKILVNIKIIYH